MYTDTHRVTPHMEKESSNTIPTIKNTNSEYGSDVDETSWTNELSLEEMKDQAHIDIADIVAGVDALSAEDLMKKVERFFEKVKTNSADAGFVQSFRKIAEENILAKNGDLLSETLTAFSSDQFNERITDRKRRETRNQLRNNLEGTEDEEMVN